MRARLAELRGCGRALTQPGNAIFDISCAPGVAPQITVARSTIEDCSVLDCYKRGFASVPCPSGAEARTGIGVNLGPSGPEPPSAKAADDDSSHGKCVDPPAPGSNSSKTDAGRGEAEIIQATVRASYGAFRRCYEAGLARNPQLTGNVGVRFIIETDGRTSKSQIVSNTLPDCAVTTCVRNAFGRLVFPPPPGKSVTVVYPITLEADAAPVSADAKPKANAFKSHP